MKKIIVLAITFYFSISITFSQSTWNIEAKNIDPSNYFGVTVANGMVGIVSAPDPLKVKETVLNGAFDTYGRGRVSNIMKVFDFASMDLDVNGKRLTAKDISNFIQNLDMKNAEFNTTFDYQNLISVKQTILALRHLPYTSLIQIEIKAKKDVEITPHSILSTPENLRDVKNMYHVIDRPHALIPLMTSVAKSPTGKLTLAASNSIIFEEPRGQEPALTHEEWDTGMHRLKFNKKLIAGETYRFAVVASVIGSNQVADPHSEAERLTIFAALEKTERLKSKHRNEWENLWESDVLVEGDDELQRDIHSAIYHLYSFCRAGQAYSLSPMGLSGLGYNGHVFWDTELWMYPPLLLLQPEMAKSILEYRFQRLETAKKNAKSHGFKGAMFPWESDDDGQESTPVWALTGPFQHHVTGCVGHAFWKYYELTGDKIWLKDRGYPVLKEVADFWASRVEKGTDGKYHIINVVCADEWAENVDDNAFTNGIAKTVLMYATYAAEELKIEPDPAWEKIAKDIVILKFPDGTTKEHATYNGELIKQTDVNLLSFPLTEINKPDDIRRDLEYYEKVLAGNTKERPNDSPAMAQAIFSILWNRLGNTEKAYEQFNRSYAPNKVPPFGVLAETPGGTNPYFATGAGGFLQNLIFGFGGMDLSEDGLMQIKGIQIPKQWKSLTIKGVGNKNETFLVK
ncbi:MAG: glycoside hydrolase family 65 protein [Bacteroidota bacterium]